MALYIPATLGKGLLQRKDELGSLLAAAPYRFFDLTQLEFVFLCFTNRSGSNYLAQLLASSEQIGLAREDLNADTFLNWSKEREIKRFDEGFETLAFEVAWNKRATFKISVEQIALLAWTGILERILPRSKFVVIERIDRLAQSISWQIAKATRLFTSYDRNHTVFDPDVFWDWETIRRDIDGTISAQQGAIEFFAVNGINYYVTQYERILESPAEAGNDVCRWLGLRDGLCRPEKIGLQKQESALNAMWRDKFLAHAREDYARHTLQLLEEALIEPRHDEDI